MTVLGYKIDKDGLYISDERIKGINNVIIPKSIQDGKAFLGLVNYYGIKYVYDCWFIICIFKEQYKICVECKSE